MRLACPNCGNDVRLRDRSCSRCGQGFGPFNLVAMVARNFGGWLSRITALRCPTCQRPSPVRARNCVHCGQPMTVGAAVEVTLTPLRRRWHQFIKRATAKTMRRIQWGYLGLSLALLWGMLGYTETHHATDWLGQAALSILYLAAFAVLAALLVPKNVWTSFARHTSPRVKLGVVVNYLTLLLLLQNFIGAWWTRASILAGLFVVSWTGSWVLCRLFWPAYLGAAEILLGGARGFDASDPQGRTVRND